MSQLFFCFSLQRSGHHAIMNWILSHFYPFPKISHGYVRGGRIKQGLVEPGKLYASPLKDLKGKLDAGRSDIVINCEDQHLRLNFNHLAHHIPHFTKNDVRGVVILRDPFNNIASGIRHQQATPERLMFIWKEHANEFLGKTNFLPNKISISFNSWFLSKTYRDSLSQKIGGEEPDEHIVNYVPIPSSFDGLAFQHSAQKMKVLDRWQMLFDLELDLSEVFDSEVIDASRIIFGEDFVNPIVQKLQLS